MAEKKSDAPSATLREWMDAINRKYDGGVVKEGGKFDALRLNRFSSGSLNLDLALGGGWPFGRVAILAGEYSTGKTVIATKAAACVEKHDHLTKKHRDVVVPEKFQPGRALIVDVEGAFDLEWAKALGFNDAHHYVARPEYAEQAIDIVTAAIRDNWFDLIVVDSLAAFTPATEIEESSEDWQMGLAARLINKAMRRWNASLNMLSQRKDGIGGPLLLCLNQFRMKIGFVMGDPRTLPGGKGQEFCASIIVYTKSTHLDDTKTAEASIGDFRGVVHKNKTYVPKANYEFTMALKDTDGLKKGEIDNVPALFDAGMKYSLITKGKGFVKFNGTEYPTQTALKDLLKVSEKTRALLWRSIIKQATGNLV